MSDRCWTCQTDHDRDTACPPAPVTPLRVGSLCSGYCDPWSPNQRGCRDNAERYGLCNIACQKIVGPLGGARGGAR